MWQMLINSGIFPINHIRSVARKLILHASVYLSCSSSRAHDDAQVTMVGTSSVGRSTANGTFERSRLRAIAGEFSAVGERM